MHIKNAAVGFIGLNEIINAFYVTLQSIFTIYNIMALQINLQFCIMT